MTNSTTHKSTRTTEGSIPLESIYKLSNLTKRQLSIWVDQMLLTGAPVYNVGYTFTFTGEINPQHFQRAFQALVDRSDALRTVFYEADGVPQQRVVPHFPYTVEFLDLSKEAKPAAALKSWVDQRWEIPFDLAKRLFDSVLLKTAENEFVWFLNIHHLIVDGWSRALLYQHASDLYERSLKGQLDGTPESYPAFQSFVQEERAYRFSAEYAKASAYWEEKLSCGRDPMRFYGKSPGKKLARCTRLSSNLGADRTKNLMSIAAAGGKSTSLILNIFCALLFAYLYRISGNRRLAIGTNFHNRRFDRFRETIGLLMEAVPLQVEIAEDETFISLIEKLGPESYGARRHCWYSPGNPLNNRLYQVMLSFNNWPYPPFNGLPVRVEWAHSGIGLNEGLYLAVHDVNGAGSLIIDFDFNTEVFDERQRRDASQHFLQLLDAFLKDPTQSIDSPCLLRAEEKERLLVAWNKTEHHLSTV
jgi:Condensation domain